MKQVIWIFFSISFVIAVINCEEDRHEALNNVKVDFLAQKEVQTCMNKTNVTIYDLEHAQEIINNNSIYFIDLLYDIRFLEEIENSNLQTADFDENTLKVGCFLVCLVEEKELVSVIENTNVNDIKENLREMVVFSFKLDHSDVLVKAYRMASFCADQINNETDVCKISFNFSLCYINRYKQAIIYEEYVQNAVIKHTATVLMLTEEEVHTCIKKTRVMSADIICADKIIRDNFLITDFDDETLRAGCFFACLAEKKGLIPVTSTNVDSIVRNIKKLMQNHVRAQYFETVPKWILQIVDLCVDQVKIETDHCKISLKYLQCYTNKTIIRAEPRFL